MTIPIPSPCRIRHLDLPPLAGPPGPLHTVLEDIQGNIYYSDEIHHSVVSLNHRGELRWHCGTKGSEPSQFRYPQGMSLGWIHHDGSPQRCIAISDSWNRRIQFLSLDGQYLLSWSRGGDTPFSEVADIRFIPGVLIAQEISHH